ncbi:MULTISPECIES: GNAT family N-acetyltransferase [unclassified Enterococcus]|nr:MULTISPECIES: GNAT family N-acetyltransferase [unclassified Enterococcus]MBO0460132.1 GNAT family N-acetyltransferase [Enterococcus sp. DIV1298c]MBO1300308.1 GNAT family N-acetyltransferase [Enterococcus sp. DIV1271a]
MTSEVELTLKEADEKDAQGLLKMLNQAKQETDYFIIDERSLGMSKEVLAVELTRIKESTEHLLFLALINEQVIGVVSVAPKSELTEQGEIGISILKEYWGMGLGTILLEEAIIWATENENFNTLVLDVLADNQRAIHLYHKMGFQEEARSNIELIEQDKVPTIKMKRTIEA